MGCWNHVERYVNRTLEIIDVKSKTLQYVGRKPSASPASGYLKKHVAQQQEIVTTAIKI